MRFLILFLLVGSPMSLAVDGPRLPVCVVEPSIALDLAESMLERTALNTGAGVLICDNSERTWIRDSQQRITGWKMACDKEEVFDATHRWRRRLSITKTFVCEGEVWNPQWRETSEVLSLLVHKEPRTDIPSGIYQMIQPLHENLDYVLERDGVGNPRRLDGTLLHFSRTEWVLKAPFLSPIRILVQKLSKTLNWAGPMDPVKEDSKKVVNFWYPKSKNTWTDYSATYSADSGNWGNGVYWMPREERNAKRIREKEFNIVGGIIQSKENLTTEVRDLREEAPPGNVERKRHSLRTVYVPEDGLPPRQNLRVTHVKDTQIIWLYARETHQGLNARLFIRGEDDLLVAQEAEDLEANNQFSNALTPTQRATWANAFAREDAFPLLNFAAEKVRPALP